MTLLCFRCLKLWMKPPVKCQKKKGLNIIKMCDCGCTTFYNVRAGGQDSE